MNRFSEAEAALAKLPNPKSCKAIPARYDDPGAPDDTSGGVFNSLEDVMRQDAAMAADYPRLRGKYLNLKDAGDDRIESCNEARTAYIVLLDKVRDIYADAADE